MANDDSVNVKIIGTIEGLSKTIDDAKKQIESLTEPLTRVTKAFQSFGELSIGGIGAAEIASFAKEALSAADDLYIFSQRTGIAASTLSALNVPLLQNGSSVEEFSGAIRFMNRNIQEGADGNKKIVDTFNDLGLSITKLKELSPEEQFYAIAKALSNIDDQGQLTNDAMNIFGRQAQTLIPIIKEAHGNIQQMVEGVKQLGDALTDQQVKKVHEYEDAWISLVQHTKIGVVDLILALHNLAVQSPLGGLAKSFEIIKENAELSARATQEAAQSAYLQKLQAGGFQGVQFKNGTGVTSGKGNNNDIDIDTSGGAQDNSAEQNQIAIEKSDLDTKLELYKLDEAGKKAEDQAKVDSGRITGAQMIADLKSNLTAEQTLADQNLQSEMELYDEDDARYEELLNKKKILDQQYYNQLKQLDAQAAKQQEQTWDAAFKSMQSAADQMVNGVLQGTMTWQQAMGKLFDNLAIKLIDDLVVKTTLKFIEGQAQQLAAAIQNYAAQVTAAEASADLQLAGAVLAATGSQVAGAAASTSIISDDAAKAAAGVYANVAQIPYVGWLLAPPAAAAAFLAVEAFAKFDAGTDYVPSTGLALLHQGEAVIPASQNGAGYSGGGGSNITANFTIQAIDTQSGVAFLQSNAANIASIISQQVRNGNPALTNIGK